MSNRHGCDHHKIERKLDQIIEKLDHLPLGGISLAMLAELKANTAKIARVTEELDTATKDNTPSGTCS